jgi:hypothetical protein
VSSLISGGAVRAGVRTGRVRIFDYYRYALGTIASEGLAGYAGRVSRPYFTVSRKHFDAKNITYTERLLQRLRRADSPEGGDGG